MEVRCAAEPQPDCHNDSLCLCGEFGQDSPQRHIGLKESHSRGPELDGAGAATENSSWNTILPRPMLSSTSTCSPYSPGARSCNSTLLIKTARSGEKYCTDSPRSSTNSLSV